MRRRLAPCLARIALLVAVVSGTAAVAHGQRHSLGSAPPTAPAITPPKPATSTPQPSAPIVRQPAPSSASSSTSTSTTHASAATPAHTVASQPAVPAGPVAPISTGLGAIQFLTVNFTVPAPQAITRQLSADDERTRSGALSSIGAPGQYLSHGHIPFPHSVQLDMVQLGNSEELDALLTVELDQHVVSAILVPDAAGTWRRVATLSFASSFNAGATTPSNFVRPLRSWLEPGRYRAVYHATVDGPNGDFTENEADLRLINGRAAVVISFVSGARQCDLTGQLRPPHQNCEIIQRWLEPAPNDPTHHFTLITGTGHISAHENDDPLTRSRNYRLTRLRQFSCQPFIFSDATQHFEPTANSAPCVPHDTPGPPRAERTPPQPEHP